MALINLLLIPLFVLSAQPTLVELKDESGQPIALNQEKPKLVYFWASWCPDCKEKISNYLPKLHERKDLDVLLINTDKNRKRATHFIKKYEVKIPVFYDPEKIVRKSFKVFGVPHWAVMKYDKSAGQWQLVDGEAGSNVEKLQAALAKTGVKK